MSEILFEIKGADVFIPGTVNRNLVLKDINWHLHTGGHCAILGANGSGKSSLLKLLHGDLWPCSGSVCWYDANGGKQESRIAARELTAIVSPALQEQCQRSPWPVSVEAFLLSAGNSQPAQGGAPAVRASGEDVEEILATSRLKDMSDMPLNRLSQGQLRLLLLLRAVLARPRLLLLDEYMDGLDRKNRNLALDLLQGIRDETTMVFTSHRPETLPFWCNKRLYLHAGRLQESCQHNCQFSGPNREEETPVSASCAPQTLFALSNVTVYIDRQKILEKINWQCGQGEHWRIDGDNGSGKSTFLRLLAGDEFAAADGEIRRWNPVKRRWMSSLAEARSSFMLVSDLSQVQNDYPLCALELLCTGFDNSIGLHREISAMERERAFAMLGEFFLEEDSGELAQSDIRRLSTGQLRRLYLARAMLTRPAALLLDEPLNGLDAKSRKQYLSSLRALACVGTYRPAIIMVTHYDDETPAFIRRQARLEHGCLKIVV